VARSFPHQVHVDQVPILALIQQGVLELRSFRLSWFLLRCCSSVQCRIAGFCLTLFANSFRSHFPMNAQPLTRNLILLLDIWSSRIHKGLVYTQPHSLTKPVPLMVFLKLTSLLTPPNNTARSDYASPQMTLQSWAL
jgi:hypothetical protein